MMSPSDTSLMEKKGANVDRADRDGARQVEAAEYIYRDLNCAWLCFMVMAFMAQI